jgi:ubiquinone/menaquinone biosynthesis C-methylase UbiE
VVLSALALHNIPDAAGRQQAIREIARVLRPGGRAVLVDIQHTADYVRALRECGLADARRFPSGLVTFVVMAFTWGSVQPYRVTATKVQPAAGAS